MKFQGAGVSRKLLELLELLEFCEGAGDGVVVNSQGAEVSRKLLELLELPASPEPPAATNSTRCRAPTLRVSRRKSRAR